MPPPNLQPTPPKWQLLYGLTAPRASGLSPTERIGRAFPSSFGGVVQVQVF
jgi:hypothetical protein